MTSGTITDFFVGGKTGDLSVTGAINKAQINILSGTIEDLQPGISNSSTLDIDKQNYKVVKTQNFTVKDNHLKPGSIIDVVYNIEISPKELFLKPEESKQLKSVITIEPSEYAYLFQDYLLWKSENPNIASVTKIGTVNAVNLGKTKITAQLLDESGTVIVTVKNSDDPSTDVNILAVIIILSLIALLVILLSILI